MKPALLENPVLTPEEARKIDAYWRAANYLSVGQIYLLDNPLLQSPLKLEHIKPRLLGHWGTTPGLNFIYVHFNRLIRKYGLSVIYITGPGHGGPGLVANTYLEGTYTEIYPTFPKIQKASDSSLGSFPFPVAFLAMLPQKPPVPFMRGANWGIPLPMPTGQPSTTRICWSAV